MGKSRASRAASAASHATARDVLKKREKPYKTEQQKVIAKKRRLDLTTSYAQPPAGYVFLPVGTPDLAEVCKETSRQRGFPVHVVNAKPATRMHVDPEKVSHHIHRIGYHFRAEIVEDACQALGYTMQGNNYVKWSDIRKQQQQNVISKALAKYGVQMAQEKVRETPEQVGAAIKELFPRIPEHDLNEIVRRAWQDGTSRVGSAQDLSLARRVQLATIARIRHTYTDYDRLLRAFEWKECRFLVEMDCLRKLIEWRGENDLGDDNELEEIVRETIVIDDDDDDEVGNTSNSADGEGSAGGRETGNVSDTSIEISYRPAEANDLRAEAANERNTRYFTRLQATAKRTDAERSNIARAKINAFKGRQQNGAPALVTGHSSVHGTAPGPSSSFYKQVQQAYATPYVFGQASRSSAAPLQPQSRPVRANTTAGYPQDLPLPSIERDDLRAAGSHAANRPPYDPYAAVPYREHEGKRHRAVTPVPAKPIEIIDLTSPVRDPARSRDARPEVIHVASGGYQGHHQLAPYEQRPPMYAIADQPPRQAQAAYTIGDIEVGPLVYNPRRSAVAAPEHDRRNSPMEQPAVRQVQYAHPNGSDSRYYGAQYPYDAQPNGVLRVPAAIPAPVQYRVVYTQNQHSTPQPVHGAPAPVQQISRELHHTKPPPPRLVHGEALPPYSPAQPAAGQTYTNGSVAPAQFYYPR